ncbi:MAG: hypothetical protein HYV75_08215 [Opitutae bacterium]|nr:hypothetical protein [Opitutae bacterium]
MSPRTRAGLQILVLLIVAAALMLLFPPVLRFAEGAAREVRYLWWLILLVALAVWLIWGANRKPRP